MFHVFCPAAPSLLPLSRHGKHVLDHKETARSAPALTVATHAQVNTDPTHGRNCARWTAASWRMPLQRHAHFLPFGSPWITSYARHLLSAHSTYRCETLRLPHTGFKLWRLVHRRPFGFTDRLLRRPREIRGRCNWITLADALTISSERDSRRIVWCMVD